MSKEKYNKLGTHKLLPFGGSKIEEMFLFIILYCKRNNEHGCSFLLAFGQLSRVALEAPRIYKPDL